MGRGRGGRGGRGRGQPTKGNVRSGENRLAKVMAAAGVASRRACEQIISEGRVRVNGDVVRLPQTMVDISKDKIVVDGKPIRQMQQRLYFMINKPKGYICSATAQEGVAAKPVLSILDPYLAKWRQSRPKGATPPRLFTVGRLDVNTSGLLLVTNDGLWAQKVSHPSSEVNKEYVAKVSRPPTQRELATMAEGCDMDGVFVQPLYVDLAGVDPNSRDRLRIIVTEGRNREVRRLIEYAGLQCLQLKRIRVGGLEMPDRLSVGEYREMLPHEVKRVTDKGAEGNIMVNKLNRILTSGQQGLKPQKFYR